MPAGFSLDRVQLACKHQQELITKPAWDWLAVVVGLGWDTDVILYVCMWQTERPKWHLELKLREVGASTVLHQLATATKSYSYEVYSLLNTSFLKGGQTSAIAYGKHQTGWATQGPYWTLLRLALKQSLKPSGSA